MAAGGSTKNPADNRPVLVASGGGYRTWMAGHTVTNMAPKTGVHGAADVTVHMTGTGFVTGQSTVVLGGISTATTFVSATDISYVFPLATAAKGTTQVWVTSPGGRTTGSQVFTVT